MSTRYGQLVVGPPACGKTTYCNGLAQFMRQMGRQVAIVNLDFANEQLDWDPTGTGGRGRGRGRGQEGGRGEESGSSGESDTDSDSAETKPRSDSVKEPKHCAVDVRQLVSLERVMEEFSLGPNGGLVYCMEYLLEHCDWLVEQLSSPELAHCYILFDCPGQVELYTHHTAVHDIVVKLQKALDFRLCSVHLLDSFYCCEPATFVGAVLSVASTMLRLCLPHVNVLTKVDLLPMYGPLPFTLDFYTDLSDLSPLLRYIDRGHVASEQELEEQLQRQGRGQGQGQGQRGADCRSGSDSDGDNDSESDHGRNRRSALAPPPRRSRLAKMTGELCSVLGDFGLLGFLPCNIQDATTVGRVLIAVDKANGYVFAANEALEMRRRAQLAQGQGQGQGQAGAAFEEALRQEQYKASLFAFAAQGA